MEGVGGRGADEEEFWEAGEDYAGSLGWVGGELTSCFQVDGLVCICWLRGMGE